MADEIDTQPIVESISGLTKTTEKLVGVQKAEGDKARKERKDELAASRKAIKDAKKDNKGFKRLEIRHQELLEKGKQERAISEEMSRSVADSLNINLDELQLRKDQKQALDNQKAALEQIEVAIKAAGGDPALNADFQRKTLAFQDAEKAQQAQSRTTEVTANERLEEMKAQLEANGQVATDSAKYNKLQYEIQKSELAERLKNADNSAAQKEIRDEQTALATKQGGFLGKIAEGVGGLKEGVKNAKKNAGKGVMAILKGTLIAGFALAMVAFLNSKYWEDTKKVIVEDILPGLQKFFGFLKENALAISVGFAAIVAVLAIAKVLGYLQKIKLAFIAVKAAFLAMKVFMMSTLLPTITAALAPLVPFIAIGVAIAAAIAILIGGVMAAFEDFQKTLKETGSIGEALKVGAAKFIGFILGIIPDLVLKLVGFVAGLFGFDDFKKKVSTIDPIQFIADGFKDMFDKIQAFFGRLFTNPVGAIIQLIGDTMKMYTDFGGFIYRKVLKPAIDWIGNLFGVTDASGQLEGFVGDKLNKILNFAAEIYEQYIKPIVDWVSDLFSKVASPVGAALSNAADMAKNFIKTVLRSVLPKPGGSLFSIAGIASKAIPKGVYEFAGLNPETGDLIAPAVGGGDLKPTTDGRAQQINEAGVARSGGGGGTVVVDAKSANVVNSNSNSSATFTSTNLTNSNPTVAQLALSY